MNKSSSLNIFSNMRGDIYGGITAAIVALPLALAFGVVSGLGAITGLYGAIAVGFFAALFGGTPSQVSGPTGPMTVVMTAIVMQYQHDPALVFTIVMMGGLFQILFGLLKVGHYVSYVPYPVVSGFMSGIGVIIITLQLGVLFGHDPAASVPAALAIMPQHIMHPQTAALTVGLICLAIMVFMPPSWQKYLPSALVALIAGTLTSLYLLQGAPILGEVPRGLPQIQLPHFSVHEIPNMLSSAMTLALLGTIDSLLTSLVADKVTRTHHNSNKELIGQGIGNTVAGLIGGLPGAGATMRTVINIRAGGRTPLSGVLHSLILLAFLLGLGFLVEDIPKAVLAAILLKVGWDIIDWSYLKRLWDAGVQEVDKQAVTVMVTVLVLTVFVDLIMAVAIGIIMKTLITAHRMAPHQMKAVQFIDSADTDALLTKDEKSLLQKAKGEILIVHLTGALSFGAARDLVKRFNHITQQYKTVIIDLCDADMMDTSVMVSLSDLIERLSETKTQLFISGQDSAIFHKLKKHSVFKSIPDSHIFDLRLEALLSANNPT